MAEWILYKPRRINRNATYKCSVCGFRFTTADHIEMFPYCRCGAKMDEVQ